jgi:hypothetical protein
LPLAVPEASPLSQLVTEAACNPRFARWLFTNPSSALNAVRYDPRGILGPSLPGPEFDVPAIGLTDAECRAVIAAQARSVAQLADAVLRLEAGRDRQAAPHDPVLVAS